MRRYGSPEPYEKLKELTRGRAITKESIREFIEGLELPNEANTGLLELTPHSYVGAAAELARNCEAAVKLVMEGARNRYPNASLSQPRNRPRCALRATLSATADKVTHNPKKINDLGLSFVFVFLILVAF